MRRAESRRRSTSLQSKGALLRIDAKPSRDSAKHLPSFGNTLQGVHAEILELDAGASDQILDRAGDEYVGAPEVRDPRCDVHGDATDVARLQLDLAGVEAAPHYDAEWPHRLGDRRSAAHRAGWSVKGREKPVAKIFDLLSAKPDELLTHRFVVPVEQSAPLAVAHFGGAFGRNRRCR